MGILKWVGYALGGLLIVLVILIGVIFVMSNSKLGTGYAVTPDPIAIPTDEAAVARGEHFVEGVSACIGCHGENLEGKMFIDDPSFATLAAPNLTSGAGGIGGTYTDSDWVSALRHGVAGDGRTLFAMPSHWYYYLNDADLGAIIAYVKALPPVDNELPERSVAFMPTRMLVAFGMFPTAADLIKQNGPRMTPEAGPTAEYGEYLGYVAACRDCHGNNWAGGTSQGAPVGPNLTPGGPFAAYDEAAFIKVIRTGETPGGRTLSEEMPWIEYKNMTDEELHALFAYLKTLEALPTNGS